MKQKYFSARIVKVDSKSTNYGYKLQQGQVNSIIVQMFEYFTKDKVACISNLNGSYYETHSTEQLKEISPWSELPEIQNIPSLDRVCQCQVLT